MRLKTAVIALSFSLLCLVPCAAFADSYSLQLEGATGGGNPVVYPYVFNVIDTTTHTTTTDVDLSCLNYLRDVSIGEEWAVTVSNLGTLITDGVTSIDGSSITLLKEDAYLDSLYGDGTYSNSDIQYAIWDILDSGLYSSLDSTSKSLVTAAESANENINFYDDITLFTPATDTGSNNEPQQFMSYNPLAPNDEPPPAVPEPASLVLLGTGLLGMVEILRRRLHAVEV